jgi:thiamine-monophosphate kinase
VDGRIHHLDFEPRLTLARALAEHPTLRPHCMIDLSDGLATDLGHLCDAAKLNAEIDLAKLPVSQAARQAAERTGRPAWKHALGDGEDYELCFTLGARPAAKMPARLEDTAITAIGRMTARDTDDAVRRIELILPDGSRRSLSEAGWEHRGA